MTAPFVILALLTIGAAVAAMSLRNLVHCALSLVVTLAGLAALFLQLDAEFASHPPVADATMGLFVRRQSIARPASSDSCSRSCGTNRTISAASEEII